MALGVNHLNHFPAFWGERTSTLDWCEENYLHSKYIAEFWNSTSNIFFMYIALAGMLDTIKSRVPIRFTVLYGWLFMVGFGSLLFHATLKWSMQLLDEIPMIFMACQILHILLYPFDKKTEKQASWWRKSVWPLYSIAAAVTVAYIYFENPIFHQACFAAILIGCTLAYPSFAAANTAKLADGKQVRSFVSSMILRAVLLMVSAFGIWNVDNVACSILRSMRDALPFPVLFVSPLLQFHALWHILTCAAGDYAVCGVMYLWCKGRSDKMRVKMEGKIGGLFPSLHVEPIERHKLKSK